MKKGFLQLRIWHLSIPPSPACSSFSTEGAHFVKSQGNPKLKSYAIFGTLKIVNDFREKNSVKESFT